MLFLRGEVRGGTEGRETVGSFFVVLLLLLFDAEAFEVTLHLLLVRLLLLILASLSDKAMLLMRGEVQRGTDGRETMLLVFAAAAADGFELGPSFAILSDKVMLLMRGEVQGGSDGRRTMLLVFADAAAAAVFELGPSFA
jgi:hypothetical protein